MRNTWIENMTVSLDVNERGAPDSGIQKIRFNDDYGQYKSSIWWDTPIIHLIGRQAATHLCPFFSAPPTTTHIITIMHGMVLCFLFNVFFTSYRSMVGSPKKRAKILKLQASRQHHYL